MSEHDEQVAVFCWLEIMTNRHADYAMAYAVPNGGQRHATVGRKLKKEGVKRGVLDICYPVPIGDYPGLYIEMKTESKKSQPTTDQIRWAKLLRAKGHAVALCRGSEQAILTFKEYTAGEPLTHNWEPK